MRVEFFIGLRYLFSRRHARSIAPFTLISICGVFVGVMALIVTLAVLNGFHEDLKEKILGTMPHINILNYDNGPIENYDSLIAVIESVPGVLTAAPLIYSEGMVVSEGKYNIGAILRGVDPRREEKIIRIGEYIRSGKFGFTEAPEEGGTTYPGVVIGGYMAQILRVGVGDLVTVWSPRGVRITPFGLSAPWRKFRVMGIFETGLYDADDKFVYLSLEEAQSFFGMKNAVSHLEVRVADIEHADRIRKAIIEKLGGYPFSGMDWMTYNRNLFEALKLEKMVMFVILTLIILVAAFNIVSNLTMLVMDKTREIGILRSMGLTGRSVGMVFVFTGLAIGALGTTLGTTAGYLLSAFLNKYRLIHIPGDVYFISSLSVHPRAQDFVFVVAASMLISFLATIYPATRAAMLPPVDAIRYE